MNQTPNIAIVSSLFNEHITKRLYKSACRAWQKHYNNHDLPAAYWVPGAVELPIMAQWVIQANHFDAVICFGAVIQGESSHFDYVCQQVSLGCQTVALKFDTPVIFGVLTVDNNNQALQRVGGSIGDYGEQSMLSAIQMYQNKLSLKGI